MQVIELVLNRQCEIDCGLTGEGGAFDPEGGGGAAPLPLRPHQGDGRCPLQDGEEHLWAKCEDHWETLIHCFAEVCKHTLGEKKKEEVELSEE